MTGRCRLPAPAAGRLCLRRGAFPRPPRPRQIWRLLRRPQHSSAPCMGWTIARALSSRLEKAPPRMLHLETVASFGTPFLCDRVRPPLPPLRFEWGPVSVRRERNRAELPDSVEHVGSINAQSDQLHTPYEDGSHPAGPVRELPAHSGKVASTVEALVGRIAARQVAGDVDRPHTPIVVSGVEDAATFIDREVVRARPIDVEERDLAR